METLFTIIPAIIGIYFLIGLLFSGYFFVVGAKKLDPLVAESKWTLRLLLMPGAIGLWPVLLLKLLKSNPS